MVASYGTMARAYRRSSVAMRPAKFKRRRVRFRARGRAGTRIRSRSRLSRGSRVKSLSRQGRIRRMSGPKAPSKRVIQTRSYGASITYLRQRFGRMRPLTLRKIDNKLANNYIYRLQGVNRQNTATVTRDIVTGFVDSVTTPGFHLLDYNPQPTVTNAPIHLWCLNGKLKNAGANIGKELNVNDIGHTNWNDILAGQNENGAFVANSRYQIEYQNTPVSVVPDAERYNRHKWYDIRMNLYGTVTNAVTYDVYVCKLMVDETNPFNPLYAGNDKRAIEFWQSLFQPVVYNTLMPQQYQGTRGFVVLKHKRVLIEAAQNDDLDVAPQCVQLKWFYRDGSIYDYMQNATTKGGTAVRDGGWPLRGTITSTEMTDFPQPRACVFLLIRANNNNNDTTETIQCVPSYDLIIRRKSSVN